MRSKIILTLALLFAVAHNLEAASSCAPSCEAAEEFDEVSVPWDCTLFSTCGNLHGDGELWPSDTSACSEGNYFEVEGDLVATGSCQPYVTGTEFCENTCNPCTPYYSHSGDTTPHPTNCSFFYLNADESVLIQIACDPSTPYYDYKNGQCQTQSSRCYTFCDPCQYYCIDEGNVPDPADCASFYQCNPPSSAHFTCPSGEVFDPVSGVCTGDLQCDTSTACLQRRW